MRDELGLNLKRAAVDGLIVSIRLQKQTEARKMYTNSNIKLCSSMVHISYANEFIKLASISG